MDITSVLSAIASAALAALLGVGIIETTDHGRIPVPFAMIEADFAMRVA